MNWTRFLSRLLDDDEAPKLPPISDEEARAFAAALEQREPATAVEPRRESWATRYGETWEEFLRRSASQQPKCGGDWDRDDG